MFRIFHGKSAAQRECDAGGPNFSILAVGVSTNAHLTNN